MIARYGLVSGVQSTAWQPWLYSLLLLATPRELSCLLLYINVCEATADRPAQRWVQLLEWACADASRGAGPQNLLV